VLFERGARATTICSMIVEPKTDVQDLASPVAEPVRPASQWASPWRAFRALLWCEWFAHSQMLLSFFVVWLALVWLLPLWTHSGWILFVAAAYALVAGPIYGGGDTLEGCEEFSFSFPATRAERYLARLTVAGGALLLLTVLDLLALGLDLPQFLARFYLEAGLLKPLPVLKPRLLYGLVLAFPFAVFAFSFALAAISHSRMLILTAWFWSFLAAMGLTYLSFRSEAMAWGELNGFYSAPVLMLAGIIALSGGYRAYIVKEIGYHDRPLVLPPRFWLWLLILAIGVALGIILVSLLVKEYPQLLASAP